MSGFSMDLLRFSIVLVIVGIACLSCGKAASKQWFLDTGLVSLSSLGCSAYYLPISVYSF